MGCVFAQKTLAFQFQGIFVQSWDGSRFRKGGTGQRSRINCGQNPFFRLAYRAHGQIGSVVGPALGTRQTIPRAPGAKLKPSRETIRHRCGARDDGFGRENGGRDCSAFTGLRRWHVIHNVLQETDVFLAFYTCSSTSENILGLTAHMADARRFKWAIAL
jgi:hypothetical protein